MTQSVTKAVLSAVLSAAVVIPALAAEVAWNGDGNYNLGDDDTLLFASDTTITASSKFTGSGKIIVSGGTLTLAYKMGEATPFDDFAGTVEILSGATVYSKGEGAFSEAPYDKSALGKSSVTIHFKGGTLKGFPMENNSQITGPVVLEDGTESKIDNSEANSGNGVNLRVRSTSSFSGSGKLTVTSRDRWVEFAKDIDFTGLTGEIVLDGASTQNAVFYGADYGESAKWTFDASRDFKVSPGQGNTSKFGAIATNGKGNINIGDANTTLEVGAKSGTDSTIDIPFTGNAFTLRKKGADTTLTLSSNAIFVPNSSLYVDAGTLELDGCDISGVATTFASSTTLKVTSNGGTVALGSAFGNLDLSEGELTLAAAGNWENGGKYDLFTVVGTLTGNIATKIRITGMSGHAGFDFVNDNGTVKVTVTEATLAWANKENAAWENDDAWLIGDTPCTYAAGDKVSFKDGDVIALSSPVAPGSVTISADATVTVVGSSNAKIETVAFANSGTLTIKGAVTLDSDITQESGTIAVAENATLALEGNMTIKTGAAYTGAGTIVFNGNVVTLDHSILNDSVPFKDFAGTVKLIGGAAVTQTGRSYSYPSDDDGMIAGPFGDIAKIVFQGGSISGFANANNIFIHNDMEVVAGYDNLFKATNASQDGHSPHVTFHGKFSGSGTLKLENVWNSQRVFKFACNMSEFSGKIDMSNAKSKAEIQSGATLGNGVSFEMGQLNDVTFKSRSSGATLQIGSLGYARASGATGFINESEGLVLEVGSKNEDSAINSPFAGSKTLTLVKKGTATLSLGYSCTMLDGSTVRVDEGTLELNTTTALAAPVTVKSGAVLKGTGSVASVTFEDGAKMDFAYPDSPKRGSTVDGIVAASLSGVRPTLANPPAANGGKWKLRTKAVEGGTQFYAEFMPSGLMLIFR